MLRSIFLAQVTFATASMLSELPSDLSSSIFVNSNPSIFLNSSNCLGTNSTCYSIQHEPEQAFISVPDIFNVNVNSTASRDFSSVASPLSSPWLIERMKCTPANSARDQMCVYTSPSFANNRGISVLTAPSIAAEIANYPSLLKPATRHPKALFPAPFETRQLPGRGMGVIANRTIERGERIFAHAVVGIFNTEAFLTYDDEGYEEVEELFHLAIDQLPTDVGRLVLDLASHEEEQGMEVDGVIGRLNTNMFQATFGDEDHTVIVPETARMNHDCRANTMYYLDEKSLVHYTHASRKILPGEEITTTYIDPVQRYEQRQSVIKASWGFECTCPQCTLSPAFRAESDMRIELISSLAAELEQEIPSASNSSGNLVPKAELLVSLYEQERLDSSMEEPYRLAALANAKLGKVWEVVKWTMKATEAMIISEGSRARMVDELAELRGK